MQNNEKMNQWHPAFYAAVRLDFEKDENILEFEEAYSLTDAPLEIDYVIIRKEDGQTLTNAIGHMFKRYNIVEYKSPEDKLDIDVYYKVVAYACLYKVSPRHTKSVDVSDITITLVRHRYPRKLFSQLQKSGYAIQTYRDGIYYISGSVPFRTQVIVSSKLNREEHLQLKALTNDISRNLYLEYLQDFEQKEDRNRKLADIVLQVISNSNKGKIRQWKEADPMCEALREIMKEEIEASKEEAERTGREKGRTIGELLKLISLICKKKAKGIGVKDTADMLEEEEETVYRIYEIAEDYSPDYDVDAICEAYRKAYNV